MSKPRIFLGSSAEPELLQAITRGSRPPTWSPGRLRSTREGPPRPARRALPGGRFRRVRLCPGRLDYNGCVPVRPGVAKTTWCSRLAFRRGARHATHVHPSRGRFEAAERPARADLRPPATTMTSPAEVRARSTRSSGKAIETEGSRGLVEGLWWQLSLTMRSEEEPSAVSLLRISRPRRWPERDRPGLAGGRHPFGPLLERSRGRERRDPAGILYFWRGRAPSAPECSAARGHRRDHGGNRRPRQWVLDDTVGSRPGRNARTAGVYLRADLSDLQVLDGGARRSGHSSSRGASRSGKRGRERMKSRFRDD